MIGTMLLHGMLGCVWHHPQCSLHSSPCEHLDSNSAASANSIIVTPAKTCNCHSHACLDYSNSQSTPSACGAFAPSPDGFEGQPLRFPSHDNCDCQVHCVYVAGVTTISVDRSDTAIPGEIFAHDRHFLSLLCQSAFHLRLPLRWQAASALGTCAMLSVWRL